MTNELKDELKVVTTVFEIQEPEERNMLQKDSPEITRFERTTDHHDNEMVKFEQSK